MSRNKSFLFGSAVLLSLLYPHASPALAAESGTIAPDRPGISYGSHTVEPGAFYVESGLQYSVNRTGQDAENYNLPQLQLRTGISEGIEFHLIWLGWNRDLLEGQPRVSSQSDLVLGSKIRLHQGENSNLTLMGQLSLPTGSAPATSDSTDPLLGLLFDHALGNKLQFFANVLAARYEEQGDDYTESQLAVGFGYSHSAKWASFIEYYAAFPDIAAIEETAIVDGGFTYYPNQDMQVDLSVGVGLRDTSSDFLSIGFSYRY